jgi:geranylgeranyl diphosphate synthase type II
VTTSESLAIYLEERKRLIEEKLRQVIPPDWHVPAKLREAAEYSLLAGGKRLRPIFVMAAAESVAGGGEDAARRALPFAAAVEMVHTYSLIHDDLPAMDDDDFRRGIPTNHKVFGEAFAILAGDGLLTHAFYVASQAPAYGVSAERTLTVISELARYAGLPGMVGGQAEDMLGVQGVTTLEQLEFIHLHKTSDLITFSLRAGGHAAEAGPSALEALGEFGRKIGLAFQIQDDILDLTGEEAKLGKRAGSDEKQAKVTYPYLIGLEESRRRVAQLTREAKEILLQSDLADPGWLLAIADKIMTRDS